MTFNRILKYIFIAFTALVVSKYLILWLMPSSVPFKNSTVVQEQNSTNKKLKIADKIELKIDYGILKPRIEEEYEKAQKDISLYIDESIQKQKETAYYNLSKNDGFLDWIFGYFTGWNMMWKKLKGLFGSDDNEIKMVSDKFQSDVINPDYDNTMYRIQAYIKNRTEDYYKTVITVTSKYLIDKTLTLKQQGYSNIEVDSSQVPWNNYIVSSSADGFALLELTGATGVSMFVGKLVGGKVAALLGPKVLGLITVKAAGVVAGKIAAAFSLLFAPIVDVALNEGAKKLQYSTTKNEFEAMIDLIFNEVQKDIAMYSEKTLQEIKNNIYVELNKNTIIKAIK